MGLSPSVAKSTSYKKSIKNIKIKYKNIKIKFFMNKTNILFQTFIKKFINLIND